MANLDTRSKRASSVQMLSPFILAIVLPDGTIDQGDRQHIPWTYSGISALSAALAPCRTTDIGLENRLLTIVLDGRLLDIGLENRTLIIDCPT